MSNGKNIGSLIVDLLKFEKEQKEKGKCCSNCKKYKTMECPNSKKCYSTYDRPYFERSNT